MLRSGGHFLGAWSCAIHYCIYVRAGVQDYAIYREGSKGQIGDRRFTQTRGSLENKQKEKTKTMDSLTSHKTMFNISVCFLVVLVSEYTYNVYAMSSV